MITSEQITFYSHWLPALAPGAYVATVTSTLEADKARLEQQAVTQAFHVGGPRYALTGAEVYSCYPPPGQIGEFSNTLPHIVFDRCTLPWERTIDGSDPTAPHDSWLALILLSDSDFSFEAAEEARRVPAIVPTTLQKLLRPEANVVGPKLTLAEYEQETESCRTIDLPARVFNAVMPKRRLEVSRARS